MVLIGSAAWQPVRPALQVAADEQLRRIVVPVAFGAGGLALLVYGCLAGLHPARRRPRRRVLSSRSWHARCSRSATTSRCCARRAQEAQTDALTGLGNRRALARVLECELPRATVADPLVLVLFDLDGFKHYNDTFGHPAGDALLVRLGAQPRGRSSHARGSGPSGWAATSSARC